MARVKLAPRSLLVLVVGLASVLGLACGRPALDPPDIVFVSLDTTRRDHLSLYGYERDTTPFLRELAPGAAVFTGAVAQMTITNPSHASMMTGLYPGTHEVGENTRRLADEHLTLAEILRERGYATAGFVSGHPLRREITGLFQGFDHWDSDFKRRRKGELTVAAALEWLGGRDDATRSRPVFLFVHLYDAHGPFKPAPEYLDLFASEQPGRRLDFIPKYQQVRDEEGRVLRTLQPYVDRYDAQLRYQDDLVRRLLAAFDLEETLVVVTADHGETLGDRATPLNLNHGTSVFEEQIGIPFLLRGPGVTPGRFGGHVESVDIVPTLVELLGLAEAVPAAAAAPFEGRSLLPFEQLGGEKDLDRTSFASNRARTENHADRGYVLRRREFLHTVRQESWKLIRYPGEEHDYFELYDLANDPGELADLSERHPERVRQLAGVLTAWRGGVTRESADDDEETTLSPEERRELEALGYVEDGE